MYEARVGLDKIEINNVQAIALTDWTKLNRHMNAEDNHKKIEFYPPTSHSTYRMQDGNSFGKLVIREEGPNAKFKELRFGFSYMPYGFIIFSPLNILGDNFFNLSVGEVQSYLCYLEQYINEEYGLVVSFEIARYKSIEINTTIQLSENYKEYFRQNRIIVLNMPYYKKYGEHGEREKGDDHFRASVDMAYTGGKELEFVIYKKGMPTDQVNSYMRIEIRIRSAKKLKDLLGTLDVHSVSQNDIVKVFSDLHELYFLIAYTKWEKESTKYIRRKVKVYYLDKNKHGGRWSSALIEDLKRDELNDIYPHVIDDQQLLNVVQSFLNDRKDPNRNRKRSMESVRKNVAGAFDKQGYDKILEIFHKIDQACYRSVSHNTEEFVRQVVSEYRMRRPLPDAAKK